MPDRSRLHLTTTTTRHYSIFIYMKGNRTAIFTGTFDPFTIGHASIIERALPLFDRIVVGVAAGKLKQAGADVEERTRTISHLYAHEPRIETVAYNDLTIDLAKRVAADCIIRGVRSAKDFEYERDQAEINRRLSGIETLLLFAEPGLAAISSSLVRELRYFGHPADGFLPRPSAPDSPAENPDNPKSQSQP